MGLGGSAGLGVPVVVGGGLGDGGLGWAGGGLSAEQGSQAWGPHT